MLQRLRTALAGILAIGFVAGAPLDAGEVAWRAPSGRTGVLSRRAQTLRTAPTPADLHRAMRLADPPMEAGGAFVPIVEDALPEDVRLPDRGDWTEAYPETGVTFLEYVTSRPLRPTRMRRTIVLATLGDLRDRRTVGQVADFVNAYFGLPVRVVDRFELPDRAYRRKRWQYDADEVLLDLQSRLPRDAFVLIGLTHADLFSGRLRSVYGLSYSDLNTSMVSTARIWAAPRRAADADERLRLAKLVVHEICHNLGLPHCAAHRCRMNGTMGRSDLDRAPVTLCGPCLRKVEWNIGFDRLRRYRAVAASLRRMRCRSESLAYGARIRRLERAPREGDGVAAIHLAVRDDE